jgi:hypothetical protein
VTLRENLCRDVTKLEQPNGAIESSKHATLSWPGANAGPLFDGDLYGELLRDFLVREDLYFQALIHPIDSHYLITVQVRGCRP